MFDSFQDLRLKQLKPLVLNATTIRNVEKRGPISPFLATLQKQGVPKPFPSKPSSGVYSNMVTVHVA